MSRSVAGMNGIRHRNFIQPEAAPDTEQTKREGACATHGGQEEPRPGGPMGSTILNDHRNMKLQDWDQRHREEHRDKPPSPFPSSLKFVRTLKPGKALDLACGTGRHALWLAREGWSVTAVDGSSAAVGILEPAGKATCMIESRIADLEQHEYSIAPEAWDPDF